MKIAVIVNDMAELNIDAWNNVVDFGVVAEKRRLGGRANFQMNSPRRGEFI